MIYLSFLHLNWLKSYSRKASLIVSNRRLKPPVYKITGLTRTYVKYFTAKRSITYAFLIIGSNGTKNPFTQDISHIEISEVVDDSSYNPNTMSANGMLVARTFSAPKAFRYL